MTDFFRKLFFIILVKPIMTLFIGLQVEGRSNLPKTHPFIIIANHSSHLDTVALMSLFPVRELDRIRPVAAADYFERNWLVSFLSHTFFNVLCIERKQVDKVHNPLRLLEEALSRRESLIFFPEGTRSVSNELGQFHSGITHLVWEFPNVPVIPAFLSDMGRALPKGEFVLVPFFCKIRIGEPLFLSGSKEQIVESLRASVLSLRGELKC